MTTRRTIYEPIPQPPGYPVLGTSSTSKGGYPHLGLMKLARSGPSSGSAVGPRSLVVVSGFDLVDKICDDERFDKCWKRA